MKQTELVLAPGTWFTHVADWCASHGYRVVGGTGGFIIDDGHGIQVAVTGDTLVAHRIGLQVRRPR